MKHAFSEKFTGTEKHALDLAAAEIKLITDLVALRKANGLTPDNLRAVSGLTQDEIAKFERADSDPRLSTVRRYARAVGANLEHTVTNRRSGQ